MRRRGSLVTLLLILLMGAWAVHAAADEQADALARLMIQWQSGRPGDPERESLRRDIIAAAAKMAVPPEAPEQAYRLARTAEIKIRKAAGPSSLAEAARDLERAIEIAPWTADFYYNLAAVQEKTNNPEGAIANLNLYLLAAPNAPDARKVKMKIIELEAGVQAAADSRFVQKKLVRFLNRTWSSQNPISVNGMPGDRTGFKMTIAVAEDNSAKVEVLTGFETYTFDGALEGEGILANFTGPRRQSSDKGTITVKKAGSLVRANIRFSAGGASYSYNGLFD